MTQVNKVKAGNLGTFAGVFTPSVLTILGIILFLRLGYVVGNAGLAKAILMIAIANLISILTSFSLAAIATNMKVKGGGDYYLISRTLGIEFGGAIGIVLFLAQSVSIAFYCIGFGEAVTAIAGGAQIAHMPQLIAGGALIFLFVLAWIGADLATKFQYVVMAFLIMALVSFYVGGIGKWETGLLIKNWSASGSQTGFWILFALFFPAVTGFTQGVSMSGDLEDPGKSLPLGTFLAVGISILVYFSVAVIFAASSPLASLAGDYGVMKKTAVFSFFIDAGVVAATLSSAMASFLGAPRILQSLSADKIFPILSPFAKGVGDTNNPRRGVLFSFVIAILTIVLGQLDLIAGIVSMFFLISYGLLNYATYFEANAQSPSFRPRFKWYDKRISLLGFFACLGVMLAIDFKTGVAAVAVLFAIFQYLKRTSGLSRWSDSQRSYQLKMIRDNLLAAHKELDHPRDWRPFILSLSNDERQMEELLDFAALIEGNSGMTTAVNIIEGTGYRGLKIKQKVFKELSTRIKEKERRAFPLVLSAQDVFAGASVLFQSYGIGPIHANTVLFNWEEHLVSEDTVRFIRLALQNECNIILFDDKKIETPLPEYQSEDKSEDKSGHNKNRTIDVWWNDDDTSRLMLLLAYLITRNEQWEKARIRLLVFHLDRENQENIQQLLKMLEDFRIEAKPKIVLGLDEQAVVSISKETDLVFLPVSLKDGAPFFSDQIPVEKLLPGLQNVAMAIASQKVDLDAAPDEGKSGEQALLLDEIRHSRKRLKSAQKAMETAQTEQLKEAEQKVLKEKARLDEAVKRANDEGISLETLD